jgi:hypothetical protein
LLACFHLFPLQEKVVKSTSEDKAKRLTISETDEGRKRVVAIIAGIIVARHLDTADDLFGGPEGSPRTDKMVAASIQWADMIMR